MLWKGRRASENIEDRRGIRPGQVAVGGGLGAVVVAVLLMLLGENPDKVMQNLHNQSGSQQPETRVISPEEKEMGDFVSVVLADTEDVWNAIFQQSGEQYREPTLVMYTDATESACGYAGSASGPFYCPGDEKLYIDLGFFQQMQQRLGAPGDFARAYVIAHEVGHHVQNLLGVMDKVQQMQGQVSERQFNAYMVRVELQADFYSGVWAHHAQRVKNILEAGDIEEGLNAAAAVGDDRLQKREQGFVVPDAFTHGTSAQRMRWFKHGLETGDPSQGDTFSAAEL